MQRRNKVESWISDLLKMSLLGLNPGRRQILLPLTRAKDRDMNVRWIARDTKFAAHVDYASYLALELPLLRGSFEQRLISPSAQEFELRIGITPLQPP